jgi:3-hydroxybutyryl-CoA dehydratase
LGRRVELRRSFSLNEVEAFAALSGDRNPLHLDPILAQRSRFGRPVVPGMFSAAIFSGLLATELPGPGTIYLKQHLRFVRPIYLETPVLFSVEVIRRSPRRRVAWLATQCHDLEGHLLVDGAAEVLVEPWDPPPGGAEP